MEAKRIHSLRQTAEGPGFARPLCRIIRCEGNRLAYWSGSSLPGAGTGFNDWMYFKARGSNFATTKPLSLLVIQR